MPGANERALLKGRELGADVLIMDLEDGVAPEGDDDVVIHSNASGTLCGVVLSCRRHGCRGSVRRLRHCRRSYCRHSNQPRKIVVLS